MTGRCASVRLVVLWVLAALTLGGCGVHEQERCDADAIAAFEALPAFPGVTVDVEVMRGHGCGDLVQPGDPAAFLDHYEAAMEDAGWTMRPTGRSGVFGVGPDGAVIIEHTRHAGESQVFVRVISPEALAQNEA